MDRIAAEKARVAEAETACETARVAERDDDGGGGGWGTLASILGSPNCEGDAKRTLSIVDSPPQAAEEEAAAAAAAVSAVAAASGGGNGDAAAAVDPTAASLPEPPEEAAAEARHRGRCRALKFRTFR